MVSTTPVLVPFPLASTTGELTDDAQIVIDKTTLDDALAGFTGGNLRDLVEYLDTHVQTTGSAGSINPFHFFERLTQDAGGGINDNATINITDASPVTLVGADADGHDFTLVPERTASGGILAGIPFESLFHGEIVAKADTACILIVTMRFYHFSGQANEFVSERDVEIRCAPNRRESEGMDTWNSSFPVTVGAALPTPPGGVVTQEMLDTPMPYRIECRIKAFSNADATTRIDAQLDTLQFTKFSIDFRQHAFIRGVQGEKGDAGERRPLSVRFTAAALETIDDTNLSTYANVNTVFNSVPDQNVTINLISNALTEAEGEPIVYPYMMQFTHIGGSARGESNRITFSADGNEELFFDGNEVDSFRIDRGDQVTILALGVNLPMVAVAEKIPDVRNNLLPNPVIFRPFVVSVASAADFQEALSDAGETNIMAGYAYEVGPALAGGSTIFGIQEVNTGDYMVARVTSPNTGTGSTDWNVLRGFNSHPVTLVELQFLNQIAATTQFKGATDITNAETGARIFQRDNVVTDASASGTGLVLSEAAGEQAIDSNRYSASVDQLDFNLYIVIPESYFTNRDINTIFVQVTSADGSDLFESWQLSTAFDDVTATLTNVLPAQRYFKLERGRHGPATGYRANNIVKLVQTANTRVFEPDPNTVDFTPSIRGLTLDRLAGSLQAMIKSNHVLTADEVDFFQQLTRQTTTGAEGAIAQINIKEGSPSADLDDYYVVAEILPSSDNDREITLYTDSFVTLTKLVQDTTAAEITPTLVVPSTLRGKNVYTATIPADSPFVIGNVWRPQGQVVITTGWTFDGLIQMLTNNYADDSVTREKLSAGVRNELDRAGGDTPPVEAQIPENLQTLSRDLTVTPVAGVRWAVRLPRVVPFDIGRVFFGLGNTKEQAGFTANEFEDIPNVQISPTPPANQTYRYSEDSLHNNFHFPNQKNYVLNGAVSVRNVSGATNLTNQSGKIYGCRFASQRILQSAETFDALTLGANQLLGFDHEDGLFVNVGRQDGGSRSRTYDRMLDIRNNHWSTIDFIPVNTTAEVIIPDSLSGALNVKVAVQLDNNGNDGGTHTETIAITNLASAQGTQASAPTRIFSYILPVEGPHAIVVSYWYDPIADDGVGGTRRTLFLRTTVDNPALTYNIYASYAVTESWTLPNTFERYSVNGDSGDEDGLFDPDNWHTERLRVGNMFLALIQDYRRNDDDTDPEQEIIIVTEGTAPGDSIEVHRTRLYTPASHFDFSQPTFGSNVWATSAIEIYDQSLKFDNAIPTEDNMLTLANGGDFLGYFRQDAQATDRFTIAGRLDLHPADENNVDVYAKLLHSTQQFDTLVDAQAFTLGTPVDFTFPTGVTDIDFYDFLIIQLLTAGPTRHTAFVPSGVATIPLTGTSITATTALTNIIASVNGTFQVYGIKLR